MMLTYGMAATMGALLFAALLAAVLLLFAGLKARREAAAAWIDNVRLQAMLRVSPTTVMLIGADGRIEMPRRMADWFGLAQPALTLAELAEHGGLSEAAAAGLEADVQAAPRAGRGFQRAIRPRGAQRVITMRGDRAPAELGATGGVIVWAFDATESLSEIDRLGA